MGTIRVMIVDDSAVVRRVVTDALRVDPQIEVVGSAQNGMVALSQISALRPDVLTMDIEMPELDGISTVRELRRSGHRQPIIMFSTLTERGAQATFDALAAGATDYIPKPSQVADVGDAIAQVRAGLIPLIKALAPRRRDRPSPPTQGVAAPVEQSPTAAVSSERPVPEPRTPAVTTPPAAVTPPAFDILAVGCSTGGPEALSVLLSGLPAHLRVPVVVVQHMPPVFTAQFAARLDRQLPLRVVEASAPEQLRSGSVYIAPGDYHLEVHRQQGQVWTRTTQAPPENFCRPAVDVLLRSVVNTFGGRALAVILTGMGRDGLAGCEAVVGAGGRVLVQDQASSVVWGMPGAVAGAGLAEQVVPLTQLASVARYRLDQPAGVF